MATVTSVTGVTGFFDIHVTYAHMHGCGCARTLCVLLQFGVTSVTPVTIGSKWPILGPSLASPLVSHPSRLGVTPRRHRYFRRSCRRSAAFIGICHVRLARDTCDASRQSKKRGARGGFGTMAGIWTGLSLTPLSGFIQSRAWLSTSLASR